ncbi:hypothetical protein PR048_016279, partial [Dryococelus australis]
MQIINVHNTRTANVNHYKFIRKPDFSNACIKFTQEYIKFFVTSVVRTLDKQAVHCLRVLRSTKRKQN